VENCTCSRTEEVIEALQEKLKLYEDALELIAAILPFSHEDAVDMRNIAESALRKETVKGQGREE
jgi:hypothetical protein